MKRRLFIGIPFSQDAGKYIDRKFVSFARLPIIRISPENQYVILFSLGWVDDEKLVDIVRLVSSACREISAFDIFFNRIVLAPEHNPNRIEAVGEEDSNLLDLYNKIAKTLSEFSVDRKSFHPRCTLRQIRRKLWAMLPEKPIVDISFHLSVPVMEISILEDTMVDGKRKYVTVETISLNQ